MINLPEPSDTFKLPKALYFAWLLREDARKNSAVDDIEVQKDFLIWWLLHGQKEYTRVEPLDDLTRRALFEPLPDYPQQGYFGVSRLLKYIYSIRKDIRNLYRLDNENDVFKFNQWFYLSGLKEHGYLELVDSNTLDHLNQSYEYFDEITTTKQSLPPLSTLMFFAWSLDTQTQALFDLNTLEGRENFFTWFFCEGVSQFGIESLVSNDWVDWLDDPIPSSKTTLQRLPYLAWTAREDLQQNFDLKTNEGQQGLAQWMQNSLDNTPSYQWLRIRQAQQKQALGVNLIGFALGELGIGEDIRMAAAACDTVGIPYMIINISPGGSVRENDQILAKWIQKEPTDSYYQVNIFCLTGFDNLRVYLEQGSALFDDHYNIGWWPWELPVWPQQWRGTFEVIDEIWAATTYTEKMYTAATDKPITLMPLPVSIDRVIPLSRPAMNLPEDTLIFLYVFDFNSYLERKNPQAAIDAFIKAFPIENKSVCLVLKTMNSDPNNAQWIRFKQLCATDSRIIIVDKTLDREKVLGLINLCDVYLSLHRAEGFGRTLAEAMLFGKPVIATDFSGSSDFITPQSALPVRWQKKLLKQGEYPFICEEDGAYWADANIEHAAEQMQWAVKVAHQKTLQDKTKLFAENQFSLIRIGQKIKHRLKTIQIL